MTERISIPSQTQTASSVVAKDVMPVQEPVEKECLQCLPIQRKLSVGAVDDPLEHEAVAMADTVMRMPEQNFIQRKCSHCEEEEKLQRKPLVSFIQRKESLAGATATDAISNTINASKGSGSNMYNQTQSFMQSRFGTNFSDVKIHIGGEAIQMNRELNAKAFTVGNDIYFNEGQYTPTSNEGKHLLAHELTHTVQQGGKEIQRQSLATDKDPSTILQLTINTWTDAAVIGIKQFFGQITDEAIAEIKGAPKTWSDFNSKLFETGLSIASEIPGSVGKGAKIINEVKDKWADISKLFDLAKEISLNEMQLPTSSKKNDQDTAAAVSRSYEKYYQTLSQKLNEQVDSFVSIGRTNNLDNVAIISSFMSRNFNPSHYVINKNGSVIIKQNDVSTSLAARVLYEFKAHKKVDEAIKNMYRSSLMSDTYKTKGLQPVDMVNLYTYRGLLEVGNPFAQSRVMPYNVDLSSLGFYGFVVPMEAGAFYNYFSREFLTNLTPQIKTQYSTLLNNMLNKLNAEYAVQIKYRNKLEVEAGGSKATDDKLLAALNNDDELRKLNSARRFVEPFSNMDKGGNPGYLTRVAEVLEKYETYNDLLQAELSGNATAFKVADEIDVDLPSDLSPSLKKTSATDLKSKQ